jgi:GTPase SAR1 family protein
VDVNDWDWDGFWASMGSCLIGEVLLFTYIWLALRFTSWLDTLRFSPWWILVWVAGLYILLSAISLFAEIALWISLGLSAILALPLLVVTAPATIPGYLIYDKRNKTIRQRERRPFEKLASEQFGEFKNLLSAPEKLEFAQDYYNKSLWSMLGFLSEERLTQLFSELIDDNKPWGVEQTLRGLNWTDSECEENARYLLRSEDSDKVKSASRNAIRSQLANPDRLFVQIKHMQASSSWERGLLNEILRSIPINENPELYVQICNVYTLLENAWELCTTDTTTLLDYYDGVVSRLPDEWISEIIPGWEELKRSGGRYYDRFDRRFSSIRSDFTEYSDVELPSEIERGKSILAIAARIFEAAASLPHGRERQLTYQLIGEIYPITFKRDILTLASRSESLFDLPTESQLYPESVEVLSRFMEAAKLIHRSERSGLLVTDQLAYYASALGNLQSLLQMIENETNAPDQWFLRRTVERWSEIMIKEIANKRAKSDLGVELEQPQLIGPYYQIKLVLKNQGGGLAENVRVQFDPELQLRDAGISALKSQQEVHIDYIHGGQSVSVQFQLSVNHPGNFRLPFYILYDDLERMGKVINFADIANLIGEERSFEMMGVNPYIAGPPLRTDKMFYGRADMFAYIKEHLPAGEQQNIIVLYGERRTGKTSLLYQITRHLPQPFLPVFIDLQGAAGKKEDKFWHYLAKCIYDSILEKGYSLEKPELEHFRQSDPSEHFRREFLNKVKLAIPENIPILLVDEFDVLEKSVRAGDLPKSVFDNLRSVMQHVDRLGFIFAGTYDITKLGEEYWSILFNTALWKKIELLDKDTFRLLVEDPVKNFFKYDELALDRIWQMTSGHPFFVQLICHELVSYRNENRLTYLTVQDVDNVIEDVIDQGQVHLGYMWEGLAREKKQFLVVASELLQSKGLAVASEIRKALSSYNLTVDVEEALKELKAKAILTEKEGQYDFPIGLVHKWIYLTKKLEDLI